MTKLCTDHKEFIMHLNKLHMSNVEIAKKLGVTEGTVRYHLKRFTAAIESVPFFIASLNLSVVMGSW